MATPMRRPECTAGGNAWGKFDYRGGSCKAGKNVGVQIVCSAGRGEAQHSSSWRPGGGHSTAQLLNDNARNHTVIYACTHMFLLFIISRVINSCDSECARITLSYRTAERTYLPAISTRQLAPPPPIECCSHQPMWFRTGGGASSAYHARDCVNEGGVPQPAPRLPFRITRD